ncbi:Flagellar motor switch protein FliG [Burkholderia multivorans]|nr:Flagellar motor switch protein FliG [Burkholderia multivorans]
MNAEGLTKSALLLMSIGEEEAAQVFRFLAPREVQKIGAAMAALKNVTREQVEDVLQEFVKEAEQHTALSLDSSEYIRSVLTKALGEDKAGVLIDRILQGSDTSGIEGLKWMDSGAVAELIKNEHPQIIATILVHLDRDQASEIASCFTERLRNDVILRIATLDGIQPAALRELDDVLTSLLSGSDNLKRSPMGGIRTAAEILNFMTSVHEEGVLESVRQYDPDLAQKIVDQMFVFENLLDLEDRAIQMVLKEVESETLIVALKGAPPPLRQKFLANMSQRAAELLAEDLDARGPVRVSEVETQQRRIVGRPRPPPRSPRNCSACATPRTPKGMRPATSKARRAAIRPASSRAGSRDSRPARRKRANRPRSLRRWPHRFAKRSRAPSTISPPTSRSSRSRSRSRSCVST